MATSLSAQREENKKKSNELYDKQAATVNANADASIKDVGTAYDDQQRTIAVQKLINERKVAESMANLGLTDSGLNRTQQTAVQLSAANAGYELNRQKQADISKINLQRDNSLSEIEQNRIATEMEINNTYDALEAQERAAKAKAAAEASATAIAAQQKASWIIKADGANLSRDFKGSLSSNGVTVRYNDDGTTTYIDTNSGYKTTIASTINPYTGDNNTVLSDNRSASNAAKSGDEWGYFDNGYQPKGVWGKGAFDKTANGYVKKYGDFYWANGKSRQNIFGVTNNGKLTFWVWDGSNNEYFQVKQRTDSKGNVIKDKNGNVIWDEV